MQSQLSLGQRETLARQDAPFLATGLIAGNPQSFEAHLRQAARLMAQTSASPSGRLVRHVTDLFERSVPESARLFRVEPPGLSPPPRARSALALAG